MRANTLGTHTHTRTSTQCTMPQWDRTVECEKETDLVSIWVRVASKHTHACTTRGRRERECIPWFCHLRSLSIFHSWEVVSCTASCSMKVCGEWERTSFPQKICTNVFVCVCVCFCARCCFFEMSLSYFLFNVFILLLRGRLYFFFVHYTNIPYLCFSCARVLTVSVCCIVWHQF